MATFRDVGAHVILATRNPLFNTLRALGAREVPAAAVDEASRASSEASLDFISDTSASSLGGKPHKKRKLDPLLAHVKAIEDPARPWLVFALQDENLFMAYFAVESLAWLRDVLPHVPNTLFEVVRGAEKPHRIFCDIDYDTGAPMPMLDQARALSTFKALLRVGIKDAFGVADVVMYTAQASTEKKVSWHVVVHMYRDGVELLVRDTYHLLGFMQWVCAPAYRHRVFPAMHADRMRLLDVFCAAMDITVYACKIRVFRCFGHTKARRALPLKPYPQIALTEELFGHSLVTPVTPPLESSILYFHTPVYHRRKKGLRAASPGPAAHGTPSPPPRVGGPAHLSLTKVIWLDDGAGSASDGSDEAPRARDVFPQAQVHAQPHWPIAAAMEFRLSDSEYGRCGHDPAQLFALMVQRVHGAKFLPEDGVVRELCHSNPRQGMVQIAGGKYCACKGMEHRRDTEPTFMVCVFAPAHSWPWYTQRCFDTADCKPVVRYWLPLFVAELMVDAQKRRGELVHGPAYNMKDLRRTQEKAFLATLPALLAAPGAHVNKKARPL